MSFLKLCGQAGFDARADFNGDCIVDIGDFSLLRTNFLRSGPIITSPSRIVKSPSPQGSVTMTLKPGALQVTPGQIFTVDIVVAAGKQPVDAAQAVVAFDPAQIMVVDDIGDPASSIAAGDALEMKLANLVDNATGRIIYSAGQLDGKPLTGTLTLATIRFKAMAGGKPSLTLVTDGEVATKVMSVGEDVLTATSNR